MPLNTSTIHVQTQMAFSKPLKKLKKKKQPTHTHSTKAGITGLDNVQDDSHKQRERSKPRQTSRYCTIADGRALAIADAPLSLSQALGFPHGELQ